MGWRRAALSILRSPPVPHSIVASSVAVAASSLFLHIWNEAVNDQANLTCKPLAPVTGRSRLRYLVSFGLRFPLLLQAGPFKHHVPGAGPAAVIAPDVLPEVIGAVEFSEWIAFAVAVSICQMLLTSVPVICKCRATKSAHALLTKDVFGP